MSSSTNRTPTKSPPVSAMSTLADSGAQVKPAPPGTPLRGSKPAAASSVPPSPAQPIPLRPTPPTSPSKGQLQLTAALHVLSPSKVKLSSTSSNFVPIAAAAAAAAAEFPPPLPPSSQPYRASIAADGGPSLHNWTARQAFEAEQRSKTTPPAAHDSSTSSSPHDSSKSSSSSPLNDSMEDHSDKYTHTPSHSTSSRSESSSNSSSSAGSTPSTKRAAGFASIGSTPSSAVSFPASFAGLGTGGRQLVDDFDVAASDSTSTPMLDEGETVPAGPGGPTLRGTALPNKKSPEELEAEEKKDLELIKKAESVAELFKIDCTSPKAAVRSALKMVEQISSQLLSEHAPDDELFETVTPTHPGRIRYDPYGDKIPIFHRTIPHLLWFEAKPPKRTGYPADIQVLLMPYWVFPSPPDNSCIPTSLARALQPDSLRGGVLACDTFLAKDVKGAFAEIKAFREKCGKFMDEAAAGRKDRTAQFVKLCNVFAFDASPVPAPAKSDKGKDIQAAKNAEWEAAFKRKRDQIAGTDAVVAEDFGALVALMENCHVQQCTYRSTIDSDVAQFRPDCDFPEGLVTSGLVGQRWPPDQEVAEEFPLFEGSTPGARGLTFLHYLRHSHEEETEQLALLPAPAKTDEEFEKMLKDVRLGQVHGVGHCEPMFPATNFVNQSVSNPTFRCDPAMWVPMLHMAKCRYFFTPYHVYRKVANGSEFEHARVGSVLGLPGDEKKGGTFVVLATFVRLSSRHWDSAREHQQRQINRALDLAATPDEKKQGEAATKAKQVLDDVAGRPNWDLNWDRLSPVAMVVLARIKLADKPKRKDLQAELTRIGVAAEGKALPPLDIQVLGMLDIVINKKGEFREIEDYEPIPAKGKKKAAVPVPEDAGKVQVFVKSTVAEIQAEKGKKPARGKKKTPADDRPITRCILDDTIIPLQLDWPGRLTDAAVDAIWDSGLKEQVAEASGPAGLVRLNGAPLSVDELHEEFLEEVSAKAMVPFDERPLRLIRTVFTDACPWEHQFPLCGEGDVPLQEEQEAQAAGEKQKPPAFIPFLPPKAGASDRDWEHAYERYLRNFSGEEAAWSKGTMAGRWKSLASHFFEPNNPFRNLVAGFKAKFPKETNPSIIGSWIKQETKTRDPQLYLHLHLSPLYMPEFHAEIRDPESKWRQAPYLQTIPRIDPTLMIDPPPASEQGDQEEEEERKSGKSNGKKKNGTERPIIDLLSPEAQSLSDKANKAAQKAAQKAAIAVEKVQKAAEAEKLAQAAAKKAAAQKKEEEKKIEAAKKEAAKLREAAAKEAASSARSVSGRSAPRDRLCERHAHHASPLRSPSPAPKRHRQEESREFREMKEQMKQMQAALRAALPVPIAPVPALAPTPAVAPIFAPTPAVAPIFAPTPAVAPIFAPTPVAPVSTSAVAPSLTAQQIQQARDFAGSDPAKFAQYCQWLQSGAAAPAAPVAAPAASSPAALAPVAFSPAFLQQATQFAGTDAPKFDHFLSAFNQMRPQLAPPAAAAAAAAASSSLSVPMEDIIQIVHQTLDAQQRSPSRRRDDLLQLWGPQQSSGYTQGRESGMQEMAWAQQQHQAAMMRGYFMRH